MISFVWSDQYPFLAGTGGSENYTAGQARELLRRGIDTRIITIGLGEKDGRDDFTDIPFLSLKDKKELEELDDTLVFVTYPLHVRTRNPSYAVLHCPPPKFSRNHETLYDLNAFKGKRLITASKYAAGLWRRQLRSLSGRMPTVYPFAAPEFAAVERPKRQPGSKRRILFAGRLIADKGIYTLLASLHMDVLADESYEITVTTSGAHTKEGKVILGLMQAHPWIKVVEARKTAADMARLLARYDIVVMPTTDIYWHELFGILSVEAQHAGCRVVASNAGGLPETNIGGALFVEPDNPNALAIGLARAIKLGPLTASERARASRQFTLAQSVDSLLKVIRYKEEPDRAPEALPQLQFTKKQTFSRLNPLLQSTRGQTKRPA